MKVGACFTVEDEWLPTGDVGDGADPVVLGAICEWLWGRWRLPSIQVWQVEKCRETSVYSAVVSVFAMASNSGWLPGIQHSSLDKTYSEETN